MARLGDDDAREALIEVVGGAVVDPQHVHVLEVEGDRSLVTGDLDGQLVLAARCEARRFERRERAARQTAGEDREVVHRHVAVLVAALAGNAHALGLDRALLHDRLDDAGDLLDGLAREELYEVDGVTADVSQRARAGLVLLEAPRQRRLRIHEPVLPVRGAHLLHGADTTRGDEIARAGESRHATVSEAEHRDRAGSTGRLDHAVGVGHGVGERLLAEHVLAGLQRSDRDLVV